MHAITVVTKMDTRHYDTQIKELRERIVPVVEKHPGFVSGTWIYDRANGRACSLVVFDSAEHAAQLAEMVRAATSERSRVDAGVELETIWIGEVQAQARR